MRSDVLSAQPATFTPQLAIQRFNPLGLDSHPLKTVSENTAVAKMAKDFEAMVITQLLKPMFDMIETKEAFGGGSAEVTMRSFYVEEIGKSIATQGRLGIAETVQRQMLQYQEVSNEL